MVTMKFLQPDKPCELIGKMTQSIKLIIDTLGYFLKISESCNPCLLSHPEMYKLTQ